MTAPARSAPSGKATNDPIYIRKNAVDRDTSSEQPYIAVANTFARPMCRRMATCLPRKADKSLLPRHVATPANSSPASKSASSNPKPSMACTGAAGEEGGPTSSALIQPPSFCVWKLSVSSRPSHSRSTSVTRPSTSASSATSRSRFQVAQRHSEGRPGSYRSPQSCKSYCQ